MDEFTPEALLNALSSVEKRNSPPKYLFAYSDRAAKHYSKMFPAYIIISSKGKRYKNGERQEEKTIKERKINK